MKYWTDEYDTYASETIDFVCREQIKVGIITSPDEFDKDWWEEIDGEGLMWTIPIEDVNLNYRLYKEDKEYTAMINKKYKMKIKDFFKQHKEDCYTETEKAWFVCSTVY